MTYTTQEFDKAVTRAVEREREKWQNTQVFWKDEHGNTHPVPVLLRVEWGGVIMVEIQPPAQGKKDD